jgi:hypothetical protein
LISPGDWVPFPQAGAISIAVAVERASGLFPEGARNLISAHTFDLRFVLHLVGDVERDGLPDGSDVYGAQSHQYNYAEVERNLAQPRGFAVGLTGWL